MALRSAALFLAVPLLLFGASGKPSAQKSAAVLTQRPCTPQAASGSEPPIIDVSSLSLDALGRHKLMLGVVHDGERFCYRYIWNGAEQNVAPTLRVRRGDRFALRLVNEISGPAPGKTFSGDPLQHCMPMPMKSARVAAFSGYLNHALYARFMPAMEAVDVNMHFHGFQGPPQDENVFLSTLSTPAHACDYDVTIPRTQPPGTYFYHTHAHGVSGPEINGGLAGMWIVEP